MVPRHWAPGCCVARSGLPRCGHPEAPLLPRAFWLPPAESLSPKAPLPPLVHPLFSPAPPVSCFRNARECFGKQTCRLQASRRYSDYGIPGVHGPACSMNPKSQGIGSPAAVPLTCPAGSPDQQRCFPGARWRGGQGVGEACAGAFSALCSHFCVRVALLGETQIPVPQTPSSLCCRRGQRPGPSTLR